MAARQSQAGGSAGSKADRKVKDPDAPDHLSPRTQISGGGGENDIHGRHNAAGKRRKQASSEEKKHEADGRRPG